MRCKCIHFSYQNFLQLNFYFSFRMPCSSRHPSKLVRQSPPSCNNPLYSTGPLIPWDAPDFAPTQRINFRRDGSARGRVVCEGGRARVCKEGAEVDRSAMKACTPACPKLPSKLPPSITSIPDVTSPVADLHKSDPLLLALLTDYKEPYRVAVALVAQSTDFFLARDDVSTSGERGRLRRRGEDCHG